MPLTKFETLQKKKKIILNRWWKYAILSVLKKSKEDRKTKHQEKLLETINSSALNKIFEFKLPGALKDVYQNEMDRIVANIIEDKIQEKPA